jgi:hypothetical protein
VLNIVASTATELNPDFVQSKRISRESNTTWLERNLTKLAGEPGARGCAYLVLLGGTKEAYFHLRVAQGQLRNDMSPSHWSHVALLRGSGPTAKGALWEVSLEPKGGFGYPPSDNGVQVGHLENYASRSQYPNVAVMRLPVKLSEMRGVLQRFKRQRAEIDCVELTLLWLGYVWGVGRVGNPLLDGYGTPSAAFIEALVSACGYDLTPGLESRASCPEAIWQAARWWHEFHGGRSDSSAIRGMWHTEHYLGK